MKTIEEQRRKIEAYALTQRVTKSQSFSSPSGKYLLVIGSHEAEKGYWNYTSGRVFRCDEHGAAQNEIAWVARNYSSFPFAWVENHPDGPFLVCGFNYQGQTVVQLDTGERRDYLPPEAEKGYAFCWADIHPSPTGRFLAVSGCFWACPYQVNIYDFSKPLEMPWPLLHEEDEESVFEWDDDETVQVGRMVECRKTDGKPETALSVEELEEMYEEQKRLGKPICDDELFENRKISRPLKVTREG